MNKLSTSAIAVTLVLTAPLMASAATSHSRPAASDSSSAGITKAEAMQEIQTDGYTHVRDLRKDKSGWTAKAMEGGKQVSLSVDKVGGVQKQ